MSIKPVNASGGSRVFCLPCRWPPPGLPWTFGHRAMIRWLR